jgi:hypothetical protein
VEPGPQQAFLATHGIHVVGFALDGLMPPNSVLETLMRLLGITALLDGLTHPLQPATTFSSQTVLLAFQQHSLAKLATLST